MGQFLSRCENLPALQEFQHTNEPALKKNNSIRLNSFNDTWSKCLRFYYIPVRKFDWVINGENGTLYPGVCG
jgi:hypothetical protein